MTTRTRTFAHMFFQENMSAVERLLQIHVKLGGERPGRRWGSEGLNKSAVVLLVACWEAYLEDLCFCAFESNLASEPVGDGWKKVLTEHRNKTIKQFHNPTAEHIDDLFLRTLGIPKISDSWHWAGMSVANAKVKLNKIVNVRHSVAHRVQHCAAIHLNEVKSFQGHVRYLVERMDADIIRRSRRANGKGRSSVSHQQGAGSDGKKGEELRKLPVMQKRQHE
jgi:hypothetical protein